MIVLFRANGIFASRVNKYSDYYKKQGLEYRIVGWDRLGEQPQKDNYVFFSYKTKYVQGGMAAIIARIKWMLFVYRYLKKGRKNIKTVHACDLDVAFPSVLFKRLYNKELNIIFDVCDWMSASLNGGGLKKVIERIEKYTVRNCNSLILCEPERIHQIPFEVKIPVHIMRNIPSFDDLSFLDTATIQPFNNGNITIAYVGWFGHGRFLHELLDFVDRREVNLLIAGFGMESIEERCKAMNDKLPNVRFFGKVDYKFGLQIMNSADLIYAMYCKSIPNHFYAAPNKFYESLLLGKPILSTAGIPLADKILTAGSGFVIEETMEELESFFDTVTKKELKNKGEEAKKQWSFYQDLTRKFMEEEYSTMI